MSFSAKFLLYLSSLSFLFCISPFLSFLFLHFFLKCTPSPPPPGGWGYISISEKPCYRICLWSQLFKTALAVVHRDAFFLADLICKKFHYKVLLPICKLFYFDKRLSSYMWCRLSIVIVQCVTKLRSFQSVHLYNVCRPILLSRLYLLYLVCLL